MRYRDFRVEPLEGRRMLSVVWVNRGKADRFDKAYGKFAELARSVVDRAIADWNAALPGVDRKVTITAKDLKSRSKTLLGWTSGSTVTMDNNGAGSGWYFDRNVADDSEFTAPVDAFAATGNLGGREDFYTTVLHELGHVVGFTDDHSPATALNGSRSRFSSQPVYDPAHTSLADDLMSPIQTPNARRYISNYDRTLLGGVTTPTDRTF